MKLNLLKNSKKERWSLFSKKEKLTPIQQAGRRYKARRKFEDFKIVATIVLMFVFAGFMIILLPLALLFSLNILFGTGLAYNFINWLASLILLLIFQPIIIKGKNTQK